MLRDALTDHSEDDTGGHSPLHTGGGWLAQRPGLLLSVLAVAFVVAAAVLAATAPVARSVEGLDGPAPAQADDLTAVAKSD